MLAIVAFYLRHLASSDSNQTILKRRLPLVEQAVLALGFVTVEQLVKVRLAQD